ncbi:MAG: hypothetical protein ABI725_04625 [Chloroflexota bacterium]
MRIYEGAPRQNYEDVLRSIGALLDQRGIREITLNQTEDGFIVQGLTRIADEERPWNDPAARLHKETMVLREDDIARFMEEAVARRQSRGEAPTSGNAPAFYEPALRALGVYLDQQQPSDVFFLEQDQQFVVRLLMQTRAGLRHMLVEFTREEISAMITAGLRARGR